MDLNAMIVELGLTAEQIMSLESYARAIFKSAGQDIPKVGEGEFRRCAYEEFYFAEKFADSAFVPYLYKAEVYEEIKSVAEAHGYKLHAHGKMTGPHGRVVVSWLGKLFTAAVQRDHLRRVSLEKAARMSMVERLRAFAEFDKRAKKGAQIAYRERALRLGLTEASAMNFLAATSCKIGHFYPNQRVVVKAKKNGERIMPRKGSIVAMRTRGAGPTLDVDWKVRLNNGPVVELVTLV